MSRELDNILSTSLKEGVTLEEMIPLLQEHINAHGIDFFSIAQAAVTRNNRMLGVEFSTSLELDFFVNEYVENGLAAHDIVARSGLALTPQNTFGQIHFGEHIAEDDSQTYETRELFRQLSSKGMGTGTAYQVRDCDKEMDHGLSMNFGSFQARDFEVIDRIEALKHELLLAVYAIRPLLRLKLDRSLLGLVNVKLSDKEKDVLTYSGKGLNANHIAPIMNMTVFGVRYYITEICKKLGAQNIKEAIVLAYRLKLI